MKMKVERLQCDQQLTSDFATILAVILQRTRILRVNAKVNVKVHNAQVL